MLVGLIIAIVIIVALPLSRKTKKQTNQFQDVNTIKSNDNALKFVEKLDANDYFKYANEEDIDLLKSTFIKEYHPKSELTIIIDDNTDLPKDLRYYFCDGAILGSKGGVLKFLNELKTVFDKMNFKCEISNHYEDWDSNNRWFNQKITINNSEYILFNNTLDTICVAPYKVAQMLNTELKKQNINEQIYLVGAGDNGKFAILTPEQFTIISESFEIKKCRPLEVEDWAKEFDESLIN